MMFTRSGVSRTPRRAPGRTSSTAAGQVFAWAIEGPTFPWVRLLVILAVALAAVCLSTLLTLPLLRRSAQPAELRQT